MIYRDEIHKDHRPCHLYDNGCMMCDQIEDLHNIIHYWMTNNFEQIGTYGTAEICVVELISSIKKMHKEQR